VRKREFISDGLLKGHASYTSEHLWATYVACAGKVGVTRIAALNGENSPSFHLGQVLIVICDWNMPGIAGIDVLRRVRAAGFDVPFLMVTGRADSGSIWEAKEASVSAFVSKPFSQAQLEARMRIVLAKQQRVAG